MSRLSRREFVVGGASLGLLAGCGRLPWQAQPPAKVHRLGFLSNSVPPDSSPASYIEAFRQRLRELGYAEGQNIVIEWRFAEDADQFLELAAELVRLPTDIIVAKSDQAAHAAKAATSAIPIVAVPVADPVGQGLVASLARPGGNLTGLSTLSDRLAGKRLELLKESVPEVSRAAAFWNATNPGIARQFRESQDAAQVLGLELQSLEVRSPDDLDGAFEAAIKGRAGVLIELPDLPKHRRGDIIDFAAKSRLPTMVGSGGREDVAAGGLMWYGPRYANLYRRAADFVDKILKGTNPADIPVEQPMYFDFVVNMKTAQALGITFPNEILLQVTEVIP
jgi:putative ABC transport system substrate-binding protein